VRLRQLNALIAALMAFELAGCSRKTQEIDPVPSSATIEIQSNLRTQHKTIQAPIVVEVTDPAIVRALRNEFVASPNEASGRKSLWTATGSITFVEAGGGKSRFLFGISDWAATGDDNEYPLPDGFNDRLIEVIEAHQSKK